MRARLAAIASRCLSAPGGKMGSHPHPPALLCFCMPETLLEEVWW
jgi:hypothetical protein